MMSRANTFVVLGMFLSALVAAGCAQSVAPVSEVTVTVVDPSGAVLPDSEVIFKSGSKTIVSKTGKVGLTTVTLPTGKYAVAVNHYGFLKNEVSDLQVIAPEPGELRFVMKVDPSSSLPCGPCGCGGCAASVVPTATSDRPNVIPFEPILDSLPTMSNDAVIKKIRSSRCLYLWKCSTAYVRSVVIPTSRASLKTAQ
jgi:hypothetical protein